MWYFVVHHRIINLLEVTCVLKRNLKGIIFYCSSIPIQVKLEVSHHQKVDGGWKTTKPICFVLDELQAEKKKPKKNKKAGVTSKNFGAYINISKLKSVPSVVLAWRCRSLASNTKHVYVPHCATTQQLNQPCTYTIIHQAFFLIYLCYNKNISDYQIKPGPLLFWDLASCAGTTGSQAGFVEFIGLQSHRSNPSSDVLVGNAGYLWLHHAADVRIQPMFLTVG